MVELLRIDWVGIVALQAGFGNLNCRQVGSTIGRNECTKGTEISTLWATTPWIGVLDGMTVVKFLTRGVRRYGPVQTSSREDEVGQIDSLGMGETQRTSSLLGHDKPVEMGADQSLIPSR